MAPTSPESDKFETMWHYMQGGPGIFKGDYFFISSMEILAMKLKKLIIQNVQFIY